MGNYAIITVLVAVSPAASGSHQLAERARRQTVAGFEGEENTNTNCASVGEWLSDKRYTLSLGHYRCPVANLIQLC